MATGKTKTSGLASRKVAELAGDALDLRFLEEWLADFELNLRELKQETLTAEEMEIRASQSGFRTWRSALNALDHQRRTLELFVKDDVFQEFWHAVDFADREFESASGFKQVSAANGGLPSRIINFVIGWHQLPKLTRNEQLKHHKKIADACDSILESLAQLSPSSENGDDYSLLRTLDNWQVNSMFAGLRSPPSSFKREGVSKAVIENDRRNALRYTLFTAGITPAFMVAHLRTVAVRPLRLDRLPTKIRAKDAMKTYFIGCLHRALDSRDGITNQMLADIVARLADTDCHADDVRKALATQAAVDIEMIKRDLPDWEEHYRFERGKILPRK